MKYRAEIDGLRALAVIPVILYHAGLKLFGGGYVGVDIFFVISGYLITSIILAELDAGTFSLIHFYERRARRILPALFVVMFACLPFAWFWLIPQDMKSFSQSLVAVSAFTSNILFWKTSGYFDIATELKPLIHTWSLAVEEQYYVLFPPLLMLTWKLGKRWIIGLLAILFVISLACAQWLSVKDPSFAFYMLPTRGWELLIGAFIAFYYTHHTIKKHHHYIEQMGGLIGLMLIAYAIFFYNDQTPFPSIYTLAPTIGAALIIIFATHKTVVGKLLGSKLFLYIGLISYSAYLWHQPMFAFVRHRSLDEPSIYLMTALAISSFGLAYLSWRFIERPFRNKYCFTRKQVFIFAAISSILFAGIGVVGHFSGGFPQRFNYNTSIDYHWGKYNRQFKCHLQDQTLLTSERDSECFTNKPKKILLWGDSHAASLYSGLHELTLNSEYGITQLTQNGCPPILNLKLKNRENCDLINNDILKYIEANKFDIIVLHSAWNYYHHNDDLKYNLSKTINSIKTKAPLSKIIVISTVPRWNNSPQNSYIKTVGDSNKFQGIYEPIYAQAKILHDIDMALLDVEKYTSVRFISPSKYLCKPFIAQNFCILSTSGKIEDLTYIDPSHLSQNGSLFLMSRIYNEIVND